jgi:hypothetical protein
MQLHELVWFRRRDAPDGMLCADIRRKVGEDIHLCSYKGKVSLYKPGRWDYGFMDAIEAQAVLYELLKE